MACHLLYHLAPFQERGVWRTCLRELLPHLHRFDGRRVVATVYGPGLADPGEVREALGGAGVELLAMPNEPALREVVTFLPLFESVRLVDKDDAILWAHSKGVQSPYQEVATLWRDALHYLYLERQADMLALLKTYCVAGAFKKIGRGWQRRFSSSDWHYSGSWCWYRAGNLFYRANWRRIDQFTHGIEPYPSLHFEAKSAGCLFWEKPVPACNLYSLAYWQREVTPALARWKESHPMPGQEPAKRVLVELGGGDKPQPGYSNVDLCAGADVRLDLQDICDGKTALPWPDDSVDQVYSSHCLEHVANYKLLLWEVVRVCRVGARVELRVPHWLQSMAHCDGHRHAVSETQVRHWTTDAVHHWWQGCNKRLRLLHTERVRGEAFREAREAFGSLLSDDQIMRFVPDCCHELRFSFEVIPNV